MCTASRGSLAVHIIDPLPGFASNATRAAAYANEEEQHNQWKRYSPHCRGVAATTGQTIGVGNCGDIGEYKAPDPKPHPDQQVWPTPVPRNEQEALLELRCRDFDQARYVAADEPRLRAVR
jgi:hypothetical protein